MAQQTVDAADILNAGRVKINSNFTELYDADLLKQDLNSTFNRITDLDYTLLLTDNDKAIEMDSASAHTVTVPLNSSVAFPIGTNIPVVKVGTGAVTIVAEVGVTINSSSNSLVIESQYSAALLQKVGTNEWRLLNGSPSLTWTSLVPTLTGFSSTTVEVFQYIIEGKKCTIRANVSGTGNTDDNVTITNLPGVAVGVLLQPITVVNGSTTQVGRVFISNGTTTATISATIAGGPFTDNAARQFYLTITFEIA